MKTSLKVLSQITISNRSQQFEETYGETLAIQEASAARLAIYLWTEDTRLGRFGGISIKFLDLDSPEGLIKTFLFDSDILMVEYCLPASKVKSAKDPEALFIEVISFILQSVATANQDEIKKLQTGTQKLLLHRNQLSIPFLAQQIKGYTAQVQIKLLEPEPNFCQVYLHLKDLNSGKVAVYLFAELAFMELHYLVGRITIKGETLTIGPRKLKLEDVYVQRYIARGFDYPFRIPLASLDFK